MIGDLQLDMMRFSILGVLTVFNLLRLTHAEVPAPSDVSVKCDSYGVVVEWTAAGLSQEAEFELEVKPNFGETISVRTKNHRYNISALLDDPAYNVYVARVKVRDGEQESGFAKSKAFSFNALMTVNITCGLAFPPVMLFPRDGMLFVQFVNPLHLYRNTPALRNLTRTDTLEYVSNNKTSPEFSCDVELKTCESNISFPEEQERYCVTLLGFVRQTLIKQMEPSCYSGPLYPALPITAYLVPLLAASAAFVTLALASVFLVRKVKKVIKKKNLSKLPRCLKKLPFTPLITPLEPEPYRVDMNPRVEPDVQLMLESACDSTESTGRTETPHAPSDDFAACSAEDEDECKVSESGNYQGSWNTYGNAADLSGSDTSDCYDCSHWSP